MVKPIDNDRHRIVPTNAVRPSEDAAMQPKTENPSSDRAVRAAPIAKLSQIARELSEGEPPIDHARIAQIRSAIASGKMQVEPNILADAILRHFID
jgi:flagellar biosynthesis anti-sigma factor FlgM